MSKIALNSNASGTGVFTIASPNSDTDRTLTLPDASGTVVSENASGNVAVTGDITSSGNAVITTQSPQLGRRNLIINGAMNVAQRGTSFSRGVGAAYTLDRWTDYNSGGTTSVTQVDNTLGAFPYNGLKNSIQITRSSPSGIYYFLQKVEDVTLSDGATFTLSFYAKASASVTLPARLSQYFGSGGSSAVPLSANDASLTTSWQRFEFTYTFPSIAGKTIGTSSFIEVVFDVPATTETINITGVQLEVGDVATPFEHRSYGEEIEACQRYFVKYSSVTGEVSPFSASSFAWVSGASYIPFTLTTRMRVIPTLTTSGSNPVRTYVPGASYVQTSISMSSAGASVGVNTIELDTFGTSASGFVRHEGQSWLAFDSEL